jgi:hypothetical protein
VAADSWTIIALMDHAARAVSPAFAEREIIHAYEMRPVVTLE